MTIDEELDSIFRQTAALQISVAGVMELVVDVMRGPDEEMRKEAMVTLLSAAASMRDSSARIMEVIA